MPDRRSFNLRRRDCAESRDYAATGSRTDAVKLRLGPDFKRSLLMTALTQMRNRNDPARFVAGYHL